MRIILFTFFMMLCTQLFALETKVFTLQYRTPEDMIPVITPFLQPDAKIEHFENKLIVQSSAENISTLSSLIQQMDVPVTQFMISISHGQSPPGEIMSTNQNGNIRFGTEGNAPQSLTINTIKESDQQVDTIRVDNGKVGFINTGVTIPYVTSQFGGEETSQIQWQGRSNSTSRSRNVPNPGSRTFSTSSSRNSGSGTEQAGEYGQSIDYETENHGFYVKPQLVGKEVKLDLSTQNDQPYASQSSPTQPLSTQFKAQTSMVVPLGKWVFFGGNSPNNGTNTSQYSYHTQDKGEEKRNLWLKVDIVHE